MIITPNFNVHECGMATVQLNIELEYHSSVAIFLYKSPRHIGAFVMGVVVSFRLQAIFLAFLPLDLEEVNPQRQ
jgi:hypothetical protein